MVDRLRSAAEHLEAPTCPDCHIEMKWFRSELLSDEPVPVIAHLFVCPHCKRAARADTVFRSDKGPPEKLSAPRFFAHAA
jgi:glutaredoxin